MRILGADPGSASGAIALYDGKLIDVFDVPVVTSKGRGSELDLNSLDADLSMRIGTWDHAFLELVSMRPGEGRGSGFKFGEGCGCIRGLLVARGLPITRVSPAVWKKAIGLNTDKEYSRTRALELFPELASQFQRKKDHNRAEAALLAYYGYMKLEGKLR